MCDAFYFSLTLKAENTMSTKTILLAILSFILPIVGIILYFVMKNKEAETAQYCLYAAIAAIAIGFIGGIIL